MQCCLRAENLEMTANRKMLDGLWEVPVYICRECKRYYIKLPAIDDVAYEVKFDHNTQKWDFIGSPIYHKWERWLS